MRHGVGLAAGAGLPGVGLPGAGASGSGIRDCMI